MLYRMYLRYAQKNNYKVEVLDYQSGDEAGIKSVSVSIKGPYAYGYLKAEHGGASFGSHFPFRFEC